MAMQFSDGDFVHGAQLDAILEDSEEYNVRSGCGVTATSPTSMDLNVASGVIQHGGSRVSVSAQTITLSSSDTEDRYDLIVLDGTGSASSVIGTPAPDSSTAPSAPDLPNDRVLLAVIFVEGGTTEISSSDINDSRNPRDETHTFATGSLTLQADASSSGSGTLDLDIGGSTQAQVDNNGVLSFPNGSLDLPQGSAVSPTAEGRAAWDTDDDVLKVGDGTGTKTLEPFVQADYVAITTDSGLDNERTLNAGDGMSLTDNGAGSNVTLDVGAGNGLSINGNNIDIATGGVGTNELDETVSYSFTSAQTIDISTNNANILTLENSAETNHHELRFDTDGTDGFQLNLFDAGASTEHKIFALVPDHGTGRRIQLTHNMFENGGALMRGVNDVTGSGGTTTINQDDHLVTVDTSSNSETINLPSSPDAGEEHVVKRNGSNSVTVDGNGNNIDGSASISLGSDDARARVIFSGGLSEWQRVD